LPQSNNWFVWDKRVDEKQKDTQSDCELAWVKSKWSSVRIFRHLWKGMIKASERGQHRVHPTQKPVALAEWSFDYFKEVNTVLDLFGGSGSTLIACEKTKRTCYMMEFEPHYCDVIVKRWEDFTGKKAVLLTEVTETA
jgi:DNA modification methylase